MDSYKQDLNKILDKLQDELAMIRVGRANPKIVEKICLTFEAVAYEQDLKIKTNIEDNII